MNYEAFKNLEHIPKLLAYLEEIKIKVDRLEENLLIKLDLTTRKDVKKYLNISDGTITNYINDGRFKINVHYKKEIKGIKPKITFIESGILDFKEKYK